MILKDGLLEGFIIVRIKTNKEWRERIEFLRAHGFTMEWDDLPNKKTDGDDVLLCIDTNCRDLGWSAIAEEDRITETWEEVLSDLKLSSDTNCVRSRCICDSKVLAWSGCKCGRFTVELEEELYRS